MCGGGKATRALVSSNALGNKAHSREAIVGDLGSKGFGAILESKILILCKVKQGPSPFLVLHSIFQLRVLWTLVHAGPF
jgi:hypothetical protein